MGGFCEQLAVKFCCRGLKDPQLNVLKGTLVFWIQATDFFKVHVLRITLPYTANLQVEATDGTDKEAANLTWAQQTGADYYVVKINGTDILPDVIIGKQTSLEVHYHTLVMKNNKEDTPETTVCAEVTALHSTAGVIARTKDPSCITMGKL